MPDQCAYSNRVEIDLNRRGKPTDNIIVASWTGRFGEGCLPTQLLHPIDDVNEKIDGWRWVYSWNCPYRCLKGLSRGKFADHFR